MKPFFRATPALKLAELCVLDADDDGFGDVLRIWMWMRARTVTTAILKSTQMRSMFAMTSTTTGGLVDEEVTPDAPFGTTIQT